MEYPIRTMIGCQAILILCRNYQTTRQLTFKIKAMQSIYKVFHVSLHVCGMGESFVIIITYARNVGEQQKNN